MNSVSRRWLWLAAIIAAEALLFLWKCSHFFNGDSLYFFSHKIDSWAGIWQAFRAPDDLWQYRPLTFVIFSYILRPLFGLSPLGYNIFPLFVHAGNTLILFSILRTLKLSERAALIGAFLFGAHSTAFYVTYGVAFLPDLSYSIFYLLSLLCFARFLRAGKRNQLAWSATFFILALFCKEAASTLPIVALAISFFWGQEGFSSPWEKLGDAIGRSVRKAIPLLLLDILYLGFHWITKAGQIYAPGIDHPHHMEFSLHALHFKYKYLKWAFNMPDGLVFNFESAANYVIAFAVAILFMPFVIAMIRRLWSLDRLTLCGSVWFIAALSPVLLLRNLTMNHNLYVPIAGMALVFGPWFEGVMDRFAASGKMRVRAVTIAFVAVYMASVFFHSVSAVQTSWIAQASAVAEISLQDLKRLRPTIPDGATLYFVDKSSLGSLRWFYDYGSLVRLFYPAKSLDIRFIDRGYSLPNRGEMPKGAIVFEFDGSHLSENPG